MHRRVNIIMRVLKRIAAAVFAGALVLSLSVPAFAFGWYNSGDGWMYEGTNGNYARKKWLKIGDDWYHFNKDGIMDVNCWIEGKYYVGMDGVMLTNTVTPDGYQVGPDGAKVRNEANNYGAPVTVRPSAISGPGQAAGSVKPSNPNVQPDPLQGVLSAGNFLEYRGNNGHNVMFTRSSQGMLFLSVANGSAGLSGTEVDEAVVLRRNGDGYIFGKIGEASSEFTVYFGGDSVTLANCQGALAHLDGTYKRK